MKLIFTLNGRDILDGIDLRDGKANPFGWSQYKLYHVQEGFDTYLGWLYCGSPELTEEAKQSGYSSRIEND